MAGNTILLIGMPRSGTTWCGKIFDSHPATIYRHEPDSAFRLQAVPLMAPVADVEHYRQIIEDFAIAACRLRTEPVSGRVPVFPKSYHSALSFRTRQGVVLLSKALGTYWGSRNIPDFAGRDRDITMVWKSIESLGRLGLFARVLEGVRAIHILRHPCGQITSVINGEAAGRFSDKSASSEDYGLLAHLTDTGSARRHGITLDALRTMQPVERLAWRWVIFNEQAMMDTEGLDNCTTLRYEDMCRDPKNRTRELFAFAGLEWNDQTRDFIARSTGRDSGRYYSVFKDPIRAMNKWRDTLPADQADRIIAIVKDTLPGRLYFPEVPVEETAPLRA